MINIIQNTIGALQRRASTAASIITENLQMWLGFKKADVLGAELVVNGDFPVDNDPLWTKGEGWTISGGLATFDGINAYQQLRQGTLDVAVGSRYKVYYTVAGNNGVGGIQVKIGGVVLSGYNASNDIFSFEVIASSTDYIRFIPQLDFTGSISNVTVKEVAQFAPDKSTNTNNAKLFTGKALSFDGVNDSVDVPSFSLTGERTFAIWFKTNSTLSNRRLFNLSSDSGSCNITLSNGLLNCYDGTNNPIASTSFNDGVWHRLVVVMKSNDVKFYVDKLSQTLTTTNWINRVSTNKQLRIGSNTGTESFDGYISYAEIYNSAWASDDVTYDYANPNKLVFNNAASSISVSNLKGYYALSEGSGSIAYDSSGEGNNGAITGATYDDKQPTIPQLGMMDWSKGSNLIEFSEDFANAAWSKSGMTITSGFSSPNGSLSSDKLVGTTGAAIYNSGITSIASTSYTLSFYVKNIDYVNNAIAIRDDSNGEFIDVDISYTATSEWTRITHSFTTPVGCVSLRVYPQRKADGVGSMYVWGAQLEQSSTAGSYIGTAGSAAINATLIQNPNDKGKDVLGNSLRLREGGFNLDGSGYAEVADSTSLNITTAITLSAWVRFKEGQYASIISKTSSTNGFQWYVGTQTIKQKFYIGSASSTGSTNFIPLDTWAYVSVVYNGTLIQYYLNGQTDGSQSLVASIPTNALDLFIGQNNFGSERFKGVVDDVLIYDEALTATEILNNYNVGLPTHS